jgi:hypothetical protein
MFRMCTFVRQRADAFEIFHRASWMHIWVVVVGVVVVLQFEQRSHPRLPASLWKSKLCPEW